MNKSPDGSSTKQPPRKRGPRPQAVDRIARNLQKRLATGHYVADTYLPAERQLAEELNTSRTSVAAAVERLADLGLVERHVGRGSYIRPRVEKTICIVHTLHPGYRPIVNEIVALLQGVRMGLSVSGLASKELSPVDWRRDPMGVCENPAATLLVKLGDHMAPTIRRLIADGVPCVVANLEQDHPDLPASYIDHRGVTEQGASMLINMGHCRIGFIGNEPDHWFYAAARDGYVHALRRAGIAVNPQLIAMQPGSMALTGYLSARAMLERDDPPTAIVAARDGYAEGICRAAEQMGLAIGHDLSVISYDDLTWPENPDYLTTFAHPGVELGRAAAEMLLEWVLTGQRPENRKIDAPLIMRRTVAPAPRKWRPPVANHRPSNCVLARERTAHTPSGATS